MSGDGSVCSQCDYVPGAPLKSLAAQPSRAVGPQRVTVIDVDMPFFSMVSFMLKWAIASIPALIILALMFAMLGGLLAAIGGAALT